MVPVNLSGNILSDIVTDQVLRRAIARNMFDWFFHMYFSHYVKYETAEFQKQMIRLLEDDMNKLLVFCAFRGSGKSTLVTMAYVLWAILGKQGKKYVVIAGQTQRQARQHLLNIKRELETNPLLRQDLGPFREEQDEWGSLSLVISNYGAKITAASTEQSIRGMRHGQYRPDLIVADDIEDIASVQTRESRDKTHRWFSGDVVPAGDKETRIIVIGNMLHEDSLVMRLKESIERDELAGLFRKYPLLDEAGICLWPGKFPDEASIETEKKKIGNYNAWMREFMLLIIPEDDQVVISEYIRYYDRLPSEEENSFRYLIASADLAISTKETADYTAIVTAKVFGYGKDLKIYILPHPFNKRIKFVEQVEAMKLLSRRHDHQIKILIESNAFQESLVDQLVKKERCAAEGVKVYGQDKRARLSLITPYLQNGTIVFPKTGTEQLIQQMIGFGAEKHDDLCDALSMLVAYCLKNDRPSPKETMQKFFEYNKRLLEYNPNNLRHKKF